MNKKTFQYYPARVKSNTPIGCVTLDQFIRGHKSPKPATIDIFKQIEQAELNGNNERKSQLKQNNLFYFTPCVLVKPYRRYSDIKRFTGLAVLDFDHIDNANELKHHLFNTYNYIIAAWLSPSRRGVKCLVQIPVHAKLEQFKASWFAIRDEFEQFDGWDDTTKNAVLPLFQSYDAELLHREDAFIFTKTATDKYNKPFDPVRNTIPHNPVNQENRILKMASSGIRRIGAPGHPQLRSLCIALGGYVASGYIDFMSVENHVHKEIEYNAYLQKGVKGYKITATWALNEGMKKPIRL